MAPVALNAGLPRFAGFPWGPRETISLVDLGGSTGQPTARASGPVSLTRRQSHQTVTGSLATIALPGLQLKACAK